MKELLLFSLLAFFYSLHSAYPRRAKDSQRALQINNLKKGNYSVFLFNLMGRKVSQFQIEILNENTTQTLQLPSSIKPGTYNLLITDGTLRLNRTLTV